MKDQNQIDEKIIELFSEGKGISEVSANLKLLEVHPYSVGSIQKRMESLRAKHKAKTDFHLIKIIETLKWYGQFERMVDKALKEGFKDGIKKGHKMMLLYLSPIFAAMIISLVYLLIFKN